MKNLYLGKMIYLIITTFLSSQLIAMYDEDEEYEDKEYENDIAYPSKCAELIDWLKENTSPQNTMSARQIKKLFIAKDKSREKKFKNILAVLQYIRKTKATIIEHEKIGRTYFYWALKEEENFTKIKSIENTTNNIEYGLDLENIIHTKRASGRRKEIANNSKYNNDFNNIIYKTNRKSINYFEINNDIIRKSKRIKLSDWEIQKIKEDRKKADERGFILI
jgi:hypothetical protein